MVDALIVKAAVSPSLIVVGETESVIFGGFGGFGFFAAKAESMFPGNSVTNKATTTPDLAVSGPRMI